MPDDVQQRAVDAHAQLRSISRETGIEYPAAEVARVMLRAIGDEGRCNDHAIADAVERLFRRYLPDVALKAGVGETLHDLARMGTRRWCRCR